jgi:DNA repair exonuclease SbcCD nuclease subunit
MTKILHCSDFHLRDREIEECEKCLAFLVDTAESEAVDLVVIAGDIFDSQDVKLDSKSARLAIKTVSALADIAPVAIVLGTPSHDGKAPEILRFARGKYNIEVASMPEQIYLQHGDFFREFKPDIKPDAILSLVNQPTKQFFQTSSGVAVSDQELGQAMSGIFAGFGAKAAGYDCPHVLVGHFNVSGAQLSTGQVMTGRDIEVSGDQLWLADAELHLLGHIHKPQQIQGNIFYSGSIYHENWGEIEDKGFYIHEVDPLSGVWASRFVETPCKRLVRIKDDLTAHNYLSSLCPLQDVETAHVRYDITAWQDGVEGIHKPTIEKAILEAGALSVDIRIIRVPRQTVRSEAVLKADSLRDKIQKMAELKGEEVEWSVLMKAESLEGRQADELLGKIARGEA